MISCLLCSYCRLRFKSIWGSVRISPQILSNNNNVILATSYCNNVEDRLKVSVSVGNTTSVFNEIYRFPGIRLGFFLQKLKWQQSVLAAVVLPSSVVLYYLKLIDSTWTLGVIVPGVWLTLNLYGFSSLFQNAVGFLYLSEDETTLKISYLDFWGKRIDEEFPVDDVVPFLDAPRPPTDYLYKQILFYSHSKTKVKLFLKFGQITDKDKFDKVFGPLE